MSRLSNLQQHSKADNPENLGALHMYEQNKYFACNQYAPGIVGICGTIPWWGSFSATSPSLSLCGRFIVTCLTKQVNNSQLTPDSKQQLEKPAVTGLTPRET